MRVNSSQLRWVIAICAIVVCACLLFGCGRGKSGSGEQGDEVGVYRVISADDVKALIDGDEPYTLVDVRTESEFIAGHIPTAVSIPGDSLSAYAPSAFPDKDELIIVYCLSGGRSANAAQLLISLGYTNVYDLGGIMMWPYEIVLD